MPATSLIPPSPSQIPHVMSNANSLFQDTILGAAVFDLNGLPKEYYITGENNNIGWVQTIFQALGLQSLLMSSLKLEGFQHATIYGTDCDAIVIRQRTYYTAMLIKRAENSPAPWELIQWAQSFEVEELRNNPRFQAA